jgi:Polyketide cyclase / dehydrase and lipid transport
VKLVVTTLTLRAGVTVPADRACVWDLAVDWQRQREWMLATHTEGGHGLGATVVGRTGLGPIGFTDQMVITEWLPPERCIVIHLGTLVKGSGELEVLPYAAGGCRISSASELRWTERLELPLPRGLGRLLVATVLGPVARFGLRWSLRRFARLAVRATSAQSA